MRRRRIVISMLCSGILASAAIGCSCAPRGGTMGGPCFIGDACNAGLTCVSGICTAPTDAGPDGLDASPSDDAPEVDAPSLPPEVAARLVISAWRVPTTPAEALAGAFDLDGDGSLDHAYGDTTAASDGAAATAVASAVDRAVEIDLVALLRSGADGGIAFTPGALVSPSACDGATPPVCGRHLDGTGTFVATPTTPLYAMHVADRFWTRQAHILTVPLSFAGEPPFRVAIEEAGIEVAAGEPRRGFVRGVIPAERLEDEVAPEVAARLASAHAADCPAGACAAGSLGARVHAYDADGDGVVVAPEIAGSVSFQTLFALDVDMWDGRPVRGRDGALDAYSVVVPIELVPASF